jgi:hypothetical protein
MFCNLSIIPFPLKHCSWQVATVSCNIIFPLLLFSVLSKVLIYVDFVTRYLRLIVSSICLFMSVSMGLLTLFHTSELQLIDDFPSGSVYVNYCLATCILCVVRSYVSTLRMKKSTCVNQMIWINPLTPELNPSAQRCLARNFTGDYASWTVHIVNICVKNQQIHQLLIQ